MFKSLDIQKDMEVVGLDGNHIGTVDHLEAADRIILSKDDPKAGAAGTISSRSIGSVMWTRRSISKKSSANATSQWQVAAWNQTSSLNPRTASRPSPRRAVRLTSRAPGGCDVH